MLQAKMNNAVSKCFLPNTWLGLAVIVLSLISCQKELKTELWFVLAQQYAQAHETMIQNEAKKRETAVQDLAAREDAAAKLLKVPGPSIPELDKLLHSNDLAARKVALLNVMLRQMKDDALSAWIAETYHIEDDAHTKFFSIQCFAQLNDLQLKTLEDRLTEIFSAERDEVVIIAGLPVLTRLDKSRTKPIFIRYLKTGTDGLRAATILSLIEKQPAVFQEVQEEFAAQDVDIWAGLSKWRLPERLGLPRKTPVK